MPGQRDGSGLTALRCQGGLQRHLRDPRRLDPRRVRPGQCRLPVAVQLARLQHCRVLHARRKRNPGGWAMKKVMCRLWRCKRAASAAEFTLVLPLLILLLFGMIDVGRFMWDMNKGEKATQFGARFAIVTDPVSPGLIEADFAGGAIAPGDLIPASALGELVCTSTSCTCTGACG